MDFIAEVLLGVLFAALGVLEAYIAIAFFLHLAFCESKAARKDLC